MTAADKLNQIDERLTALGNQMQSILDSASDDCLSDNQRSQYDKLDAEYDAKLAEKDAIRADIERQDKLNERLAADGQSDLQSSGSVSQPQQLGNPRDAFLEDPQRGFKTHREFLLAAMETAQSGKISDPRIKSLAVGSDEAGTVSDPYGGFLLPAGFSPELLSVGNEGDPTAGRTMDVPMMSQTLSIPARVDKTHTSSVSGGLQVYRRNETDTASSTRMEFEQIKLEPTMLFGLSYATEELLARSPISFVALLSAGFGDEFAAKVLKEKLFGTGAGQMQGVVNAACTVSVAKETGQAAATIVYENVINMRSRCWGYSNGIWIANHDCLPQLMLMNQSVGTGGIPVWQPSAMEDHPDMLLGRPLFFSEFAETVGTLGDLICGNWSQYLEARIGEQQQAESIHVRFVNHERTFKFWLENDGKPWWTAALTPNQSSSTLSPFVTLAARA